MVNSQLHPPQEWSELKDTWNESKEIGPESKAVGNVGIQSEPQEALDRTELMRHINHSFKKPTDSQAE